MSKTKKAVALPIEQEIAGTGDGRDIMNLWVEELRQHRDPRLRGVIDWGAYEKVFKDDQVKSCLEQRWRAVVASEWEVVPGDPDDPKSKEAADALNEDLARIGVDRVTKMMLSAVFYGYSVAELMWEKGPRRWSWSSIHVRHARRFRYDKEMRLRLLTRTAPLGELLPERKFWVATEGGMTDDEIYGAGLADWLYWPVLFKRNGLRFWNLFLDKYATPTAKATYKRGTPKADIDKIVDILRALARDTGFAVPDGIAVEFMQVARSGVGDYKELCAAMDAAISKIILSQTMTTDDGASMSQAKVHAGVALNVVKADADLVCESFNDGPARWWTDVNYGPDVKSPRLVRLLDEEEDLKSLAETDEVLARNGWHRTPESFADTYGPGYEYRAPQAPVAASVPTGTKDEPATPPPANDDAATARAENFAAFDPKPLYVYRRLKNARDVIAWAKKQGFRSIMPASELHVTVMYSRRAVNWFDINGIWNSGDITVGEGGPRTVDRIGDKGAVALFFSNGELVWRNREMREAGCSWDYPDYHPHLTLTYEPGDLDLARVEPYRGKLVFGPEIFEPLDTEWNEKIEEVAFAEERAAAAEGDDIDGIVAELLRAQGYRPLDERQRSIIDVIEAANTPEEARAALLQMGDNAIAESIAQRLARASFAVRMAAEAGADV